MRSFFIFAFYLFVASTNAIEGEKKNITWDYLTFAQIWPYSVCDVANLLKNDSCSVPRKVTGGWTVHGLWPSRTDGSLGPNNCVPADHFDLDKVKNLMGELLHHWPNLIPQETLFSLWQHEWVKHGTCAEQLEAIKGEFNYFSKGLQFNERFSIRNILDQAGIAPTDEPKFKASDIEAALEKAKGKKVQVHCLKSVEEGQTKWYLVDIRICFDKQLQQIDCPQPKPGVDVQRSELIDALAIPNVQQCPKDILLHYVVPREDHYHDDDYHSAHNYAYNNYREEYGSKWDREHYEEKDDTANPGDQSEFACPKVNNGMPTADNVMSDYFSVVLGSLGLAAALLFMIVIFIIYYLCVWCKENRPPSAGNFYGLSRYDQMEETKLKVDDAMM